MFGESDSSNRRWAIAHFSNCYNIIWVSFTLTQGKLSLRGFILKPTETTYVLLKNSTRHFLHWHFFMLPSLEILEQTLKQIFWKVKTFFTKLEVTCYSRYCIMGPGVGTLSRKTRLALAVVVESHTITYILWFWPNNFHCLG